MFIPKIYHDLQAKNFFQRVAKRHWKLFGRRKKRARSEVCFTKLDWSQMPFLWYLLMKNTELILVSSPLEYDPRVITWETQANESLEMFETQFYSIESIRQKLINKPQLRAYMFELGIFDPHKYSVEVRNEGKQIVFTRND